MVDVKIGEQYQWLEEDLAKVDRSVTPWVIALTHPPWYNSYKAHYREVECMRQSMEGLLYKYGVDAMFHGHVRTSKLCTSVSRRLHLFSMVIIIV